MRFVPKVILILLTSLLLHACNGGSSDEATNTETTDSANRITIGGSVGDGPIIGATVIIKNNQGTILATATSDDHANYSISLDVHDEDLPLLLEASGGLDLVTGTSPDFPLASAVTNTTSQQANLNPHSTFITKAASMMSGGINANNLAQAKGFVITKLNYGLDPELVDDPTTAIVNVDNVVTLTHASEALAEMLRRSSQVIGNGTDETTVLSSLASDLADGVLDGVGRAGTNAYYTAVSHVVGFQVLIETMLHDLYVNGVSADAALTAAINTIMETSSKTVINDDSTNIHKVMIDQAKSALEAIRAIDSSITLNDLKQVLEDLGDGATTEEMIAALAQYSLDLTISQTLDSSIELVSSVSEEEIEAINVAANSSDSEIDLLQNTAPTISGTPAESVTVGETYRFTPNTSDPDNDNLSFNVVNLPAWASFDNTNGVLSGIPEPTDAGTYTNILISVSDGIDTATLPSFGISVTDIGGDPAPSLVPGAPILASASLNGSSVVLVWTQDNAVPAGGYDIVLDGVDTNTQYRTTLLTAEIPNLDTSVRHCFAVQARYTDTNQFFDSNELCVETVQSLNTAPMISGTPPTSAAEGVYYLFTPGASDVDGDSLAFSIINGPRWANFNTTTGTLSGTPGYEDAGLYTNIRISVSDGSISTALNSFSISVENTNRAPSISGTPVSSVAEGENYQFVPNSSDPDSDVVTFTVVNLPAWANFNSSTGAITGTPGYDDAGSYGNIQIRVSDGLDSASLPTFSINVLNTDLGGVFNFTSTSSSVNEGDAVSLTITRTNGDGEASVSYGTNGVTALHAEDYWGFNPRELVFAIGETSKQVSIQTVDNNVTESDETFEVYLTSPSTNYTIGSSARNIVTIIDDDQATNNPPEISGNPPSSVVEGSLYSFTATASDPDNNELNFSVANLPGWLSFDTTDGSLTGIPQSSDIGTYVDIAITVSDGPASATLGPFSITVEPNSNLGLVNLSWVIPTTRTDSSALSLSEIGGYRIYMGTTSDNLEMIVDINDGSTTSYSVDNLSAGTYYFAVTTYDMDDNESAFSNIAQKSM